MIEKFILTYPVFMSLLWAVGAVLHYLKYEHNELKELTIEPLVSVLVPCFNEQESIAEVVYRLHHLNYSELEIILIDDGSTDATAQIITQLAEEFDNVRAVLSKENMGKANALHLGYLCSNGEYLVCVDADAYLDSDAIYYLINPFLEHPERKIGAVTGNPQVRNRSSLLGKIQTVEFASMIGSIKRAQRMSGVIMTVSGVIATFDRQALMDVGLWDKDMITEDIAVTWKLHQKGWEIIYEPRAICWMLVPETIVGLWKQRVRWAQGGAEVLFRHFKNALQNKRFASWLLIEQIFGITWAFLWVFNLAYEITIKNNISVYGFQLFFLVCICFFQFAVSLYISSRYDQELKREIPMVIWYPIFYWYINSFVVCFAVLKMIFTKQKKFATWSSPDRGQIDDKQIELQAYEQLDYEQHISRNERAPITNFIVKIITIILWLAMFRILVSFIKYLWVNINQLHISLFAMLVHTEYTQYIVFMIVSVLVIIGVYGALDIMLSIIRRPKRKKQNITGQILKYYNLNEHQYNIFRSSKLQEISSVELLGLEGQGERDV